VWFYQAQGGRALVYPVQFAEFFQNGNVFLACYFVVIFEIAALVVAEVCEMLGEEGAVYVDEKGGMVRDVSVILVEFSGAEDEW
jgi:hypothetical protein